MLPIPVHIYSNLTSFQKVGMAMAKMESDIHKMGESDVKVLLRVMGVESQGSIPIDVTSFVQMNQTGAKLGAKYDYLVRLVVFDKLLRARKATKEE